MEASAICFKNKSQAEIVLVEGTNNTLNDAREYAPSDATDFSNGCIYSKGSFTFSGAGTLNVYGNYKHAISSAKNITINDGKINIMNTQKDGVHCDKYTQKAGIVTLQLANTATKGIKTKESFQLLGGKIEGIATGDLKINGGETSYCTLIKSDSLFIMREGEILLNHKGKGGRCISVDRNMMVTNGTMKLECHGDGDGYINAGGETDYYTPKCITVDDSLFIAGGTIRCLSTGLGGKGIVAGKYLAIGNEEEQDAPFIRVETKGECIINNEDEDLRFGCPKGIKANDELHIYSGDIAVNTAGMGGEGVECNGDMFIHGGTLECNTFDDGINVGRSLEISGGCVYCNSVDNDGIDSNGSITISGGVVASINQVAPNESFDSNEGNFNIFGGTVFGIGSCPVKISNASCPFYNTPFVNDNSTANGLRLTFEKYIYLQNDNRVVMALLNGNKARRAYLTLSFSSVSANQEYSIAEGDCPFNIILSYFNKKLVIDGRSYNSCHIKNIIM